MYLTLNYDRKIVQVRGCVASPYSKLCKGGCGDKVMFVSFLHFQRFEENFYLFVN